MLWGGNSIKRLSNLYITLKLVCVKEKEIMMKRKGSMLDVKKKRERAGQMKREDKRERESERQGKSRRETDRKTEKEINRQTETERER